jgi:hypothetical protein
MSELVPSVKLTRRVNLGNYEHYEAIIIVYDYDEHKALERASSVLDRFSRFSTAVGKDRLEVEKIPK